LSDANRGNEVGRLEDKEPSDLKRRFLVRLQPRLKFLYTRLKRVPVQSALNDLGTFLRRHIKRVTLAATVVVALGICYLFVKIMAIPSPKIVPYSDLVMRLQTGSVTKVLFEEGSRRIYFNSKVETVDTSNVKEENMAFEIGQSENVASEVALAATETSHAQSKSVLAKSSRKRAAVPEWQYSTRKVDNDESFLLSLMREKGVIYSSAPPSVLMSIRSILITILTLWIPLTPLMWLLYRQLYSTNGRAEKRRPSNQNVNFDDVEGVDSAKVELMEVRFFTIQHLMSDGKIFRYINDAVQCIVVSFPAQQVTSYLLSIGIINFLIISFWSL